MTFPPSAPVQVPCPKCALPMRTIERSGIHIEQCPECRGVFLDRGELDRLLDLEAAAMPSRQDPRPARPGPWTDDRFDERRDRDRRDRDHDRDRDDDDDWRARASDGRDPRRRRGFLGDLLEGFGD